MATVRKRKICRLLPMDELRCRPCTVNDRPALFHRWIEEDRAILKHNKSFLYTTDDLHYRERYFIEKGVCLPECAFEVVSETLALVEYQNGVVAKVKPEQVRFIHKED